MKVGNFWVKTNLKTYINCLVTLGSIVYSGNCGSKYLQILEEEGKDKPWVKKSLKARSLHK
ncbi:unnamed protein product [Prunus brigantina]